MSLLGRFRKVVFFANSLGITKCRKEADLARANADKSAELTWQVLTPLIVQMTDKRYVEWRTQALKDLDASLVGEDALGPLQQHILARQYIRLLKYFRCLRGFGFSGMGEAKMPRTIRRPHRAMTVVLTMLVSTVAAAASPDSLYSGNQKVVAARFHVILYFDARHKESENKNLVLGVMQKFTEDLRREDVPTGYLPSDFSIRTTINPSPLSNFKSLDSYIKSLGPKIEPGDVVFAWIECEGTNDNLELTGDLFPEKNWRSNCASAEGHVSPYSSQMLVEFCRVILSLCNQCLKPKAATRTYGARFILDTVALSTFNQQALAKRLLQRAGDLFLQ